MESAIKPRILLVNLIGQGFGGLETHVLNLYRQLAARGHDPLLLVAAGSEFHLRVEQEGLAHYAAWGHRLRGFRHLFPYYLTKLCRRYDIRVIHCNNRFEVPSALRVARKFSNKVVFNYHVTDPFDTGFLKGIDAVVSPGREIIHYVEEQNRIHGLGIKQIQVIPPIFDADKFLEYQSNDEPANWFATTFGITLKACPVICTIGNMVSDLQHKNYPLLFEAMARLIHEEKTLVQAVLVGDGPSRPFLEQLARSLKIQDYVHFLGYTAEHTPGVLHHSDVFVLASSKEAFGIVYLEAGLMRKPAIGARATGAELMIAHGKTGLLFENSDAASLAAAIRRLVEDPVWAGNVGLQAHQHVMQWFAPSVVTEKYENLYLK